MKSNAVGVEFDISLSDKELILLKSYTLKGTVTRRDPVDENVTELGIELKITELKRNPIAEWITTPPNASYEAVEIYHINLSQEGYQYLQEHGHVVDRFMSSSKIHIYKQNRYFE